MFLILNKLTNPKKRTYRDIDQNGIEFVIVYGEMDILKTLSLLFRPSSIVLS